MNEWAERGEDENDNSPGAPKSGTKRFSYQFIKELLCEGQSFVLNYPTAKYRVSTINADIQEVAQVPPTCERPHAHLNGAPLQGPP